MSTVTLSANDSQGMLIDTISGIFSELDIKTLHRFIVATSRVRETQMLQNGLPSITGITLNSDGLTFTCKPYSNVYLSELLHVLRHVILSKESTSFKNISGILEKRFQNEKFTQYMHDLHKLYENGELSFFCQMTIGTQPLFDNSILNTWLNGTQYHSDEKKAIAWRELEQLLQTENARALVMNQLYGRVKALFALEYIVQLILQKSESN